MKLETSEMAYQAAVHPQAQDLGKTATKHILVVDDSRMQRVLLSTALAKWGFDVAEAASGEEALAQCQLQMPDLVVSDWMMPGMSGLEFCQKFREMSKGTYGYFILLTSKSEKAEVARGLEAGADDFLTKPVDNSELRARITAGDRILRMQRELAESNRLTRETLAELQQLYNSLDKDLLEAKKLQQSLIRERHRKFSGGRLSLILRSSGHVGGDLVGFFPVGKDQLGIYGLDVSGHGVSSALMTARLAGYLSATAPDQNVALKRQEDGTYRARRLDQVIATLNAMVLNEMDTEHYFTLMIAIVDLPTGKVTIGQAGHPHPVIQRKSGAIEQYGTGGFPVGLMHGVDFEQFEVQLHPGDRLLILSDGVTECPDPAGQLLGERGLERMLRSMHRIHDSALLEAILWYLEDYAETDEFPDDVSGAVFEYDGISADTG